MVQALTSNRNRTFAEIRHCFTKNEGSLTNVSYLFTKSGRVVFSYNIPKENLLSVLSGKGHGNGGVGLMLSEVLGFSGGVLSPPQWVGKEIENLMDKCIEIDSVQDTGYIRLAFSKSSSASAAGATSTPIENTYLLSSPLECSSSSEGVDGNNGGDELIASSLTDALQDLQPLHPTLEDGLNFNLQVEIFCEPEDILTVSKSGAGLGLEMKEMDVVWYRPKDLEGGVVDLRNGGENEDVDGRELLGKLLADLDGQEDVVNVWHNARGMN
jgi:transcriptional/translational regulatory protein YebC/TACO1